MLVHPTHMQQIAQEHADAMRDSACQHYRDLQSLSAPNSRPATTVRRLLRRRSQLRSVAPGL